MTMNIILTIIAIAMIAFGANWLRLGILAISNFKDDTLKSTKIFSVFVLVAGLAVIAGGCILGRYNLPKAYTGIKQAITAESQENAENVEAEDASTTGTVDQETGTEAVAETEVTETTENPVTEVAETAESTEVVSEGDTEVITDDPGAENSTPKGSVLNVVLTVLGGFLLLGVIIGSFVAYRKRAARGKRHKLISRLIRLLAFVLAVVLLFTNAPLAYAFVTNGNKDAISDGATAETITGYTETETETEAAVQPVLPEGAFAVDLSEDDLLKAMKKLFGEDFAWETYQNNFSDDLFPSKYQERKDSSKLAMQTWYGDSTKEGFSDPVWFAIDELVNIYHTPEWQNKARDEQVAFIRQILLKCYDQVLRNPRYGEMFFELFQELAKDFPEIVERNQSWWPTLEDMYAQANDPENKVKNADGQEITAGISVFFEGVNSTGDAKVLRKEYVTSAARLCLMFEEFILTKNIIESPESRVNWHLAFGKDAQTVKVNALTAPEDQESEPAITFNYVYKSSGVKMKVGINLFDSRLEILKLGQPKQEKKTEKKKTGSSTPKQGTPPKEGTPPDNSTNPENPSNPTEPTNPDPNNPEPNPNDPEPNPNDPEPDPNEPDPNEPEPNEPTPDPNNKPKDPEQRPTGPTVPDGPTNPEDDTEQPTKPDEKPYEPVPEQPTKPDDGLPDQKPNAPEGNGNSDSSSNTTPVPPHNDTNATDDGPGGSTTTNTSDEPANSRVPAPTD